MPNKYQVEMHDGRKFEVETDGGPPNEDDVLGFLNQKNPYSNLPDVGRGDTSDSLSADERIRQAKESLAKPPVYDTTPAEPYKYQPPDTLGSFVHGLTAVPRAMYHSIDQAGKASRQHFQEGNYPAALHDIAGSLLDPFNPQSYVDNLRQIKQNFTGGATPEQAEAAKGEATGQGLGILGLDPTEFKQAWIKRNYPEMAGQAVGAIGTALLFHKLGGKLSDANIPDWSKLPEPPAEEPGSAYDWLPPDRNRPSGPIIDTPETRPERLLGPAPPPELGPGPSPRELPP